MEIAAEVWLWVGLIVEDRMRIGSVAIHCHAFDRMVTLSPEWLHAEQVVNHFAVISTRPDEIGLDPAEWSRMRTLGHAMVDDMVTLLESVRARPVWLSVPV